MSVVILLVLWPLHSSCLRRVGLQHHDRECGLDNLTFLYFKLGITCSSCIIMIVSTVWSSVGPAVYLIYISPNYLNFPRSMAMISVIIIFSCSRWWRSRSFLFEPLPDPYWAIIVLLIDHRFFALCDLGVPTCLLVWLYSITCTLLGSKVSQWAPLFFEGCPIGWCLELLVAIVANFSCPRVLLRYHLGWARKAIGFWPLVPLWCLFSQEIEDIHPLLFFKASHCLSTCILRSLCCSRWLVSICLSL